MNDEPLFVKVDKPDRSRGANGKWKPLIEALGSGDAFQIVLKQTSVARTLGHHVEASYPTKRITTHRVDETHTTVWLVDR